jgi:hypothetical protein
LTRSGPAGVVLPTATPSQDRLRVCVPDNTRARVVPPGFEVMQAR